MFPLLLPRVIIYSRENICGIIVDTNAHMTMMLLLFAIKRTQLQLLFESVTVVNNSRTCNSHIHMLFAFKHIYLSN